MCAVFGWMFLGLLISAVSALCVQQSEAMLDLIFEFPSTSNILIGIDIISVFFISKNIDKLSTKIILSIFVLYAILIGISFSATFIKYTDKSIVSTFIISGGTFGFASLIGFVTRKKTYNMGYILFLTAIGIILATFVNYFLETTIISWITTYVGLVVLMGFTYIEIKKIKQQGYYENFEKESIMSALSLYISFINIFRLWLAINGIKK